MTGAGSVAAFTSAGGRAVRHGPHLHITKRAPSLDLDPVCTPRWSSQVLARSRGLAHTGHTELRSWMPRPGLSPPRTPSLT